MQQTFEPGQTSALAAAIPAAVCILDQNAHIVAANERAHAMFGHSIVGQPFFMFLRNPAVREAFRSVLADDDTQTKARNHSHAPTAITLDVSFARLGIDTNGLPLVLTLCTDATREENIERMRSDFVANASHELRTPLTTLSGFIDTMQGAAAKDEKARFEFLKVMRAQADRMSRLIEDLLSLSRIEVDEHVAPHETVNLSGVIGQARSLLQSLANDTGCKLEVSIPARMPVKGDSGQLGQVMYNLIENALKYSGRGKQVVVSGGIEQGGVVIRVTDNGPGIAAHHIPRLTERFYRANVQDSRTRGGTGLGLAIVKHIVSRHRGRLQIESELGQGSTFSVHFPLAR
jgi:two-component system phosphate regulon sensor histidine kinase PhoR